MIDVSTVKADIVMDEVDEMISIVKKRHCICASPMPWVTHYTIEQLSEVKDTVVTGVVSFPSGANSTSIKEMEAKELISMGCKELDMVMNISAMKSGQYEYVEKDIQRVVYAASGVPVKVILETSYLTDDEIQRASEIGVRAGATFIKTGTGWGAKPTTVETIKLIRSTIGNDAKIKAAGGVKDLATLLEMKEASCNRFGLGVRTANRIFAEIDDILKK
nr:deoxyribose-phosphate aldolase [Enterococcus faecalis]